MMLKRVPIYLQSTSAECGLACIAMVAASKLGQELPLPTMRTEFPVSMRGANLRELMDVAHRLGLTARPLRAEPEHLTDFDLPCILHWDFNHFVVLERVTRNHLSVIDPAIGPRRLTWRELSQHFTGVVVEMKKSAGTEPPKVRPKRRLNLFGMLRQLDLRGRLAPAILTALTLEGLVLIGPLYLKAITDEVIGASNSDLLIALAIGFGLLVVFQVGTGILRSFALVNLSSAINAQWQNSLFQRVVRLPITFFKNRSLADIASRFNGITGLQRIMSSSALEVLLDALMSFVLLFMMLLFIPTVALIAVGATAVVIGIRLLLFRRLRLLTEYQLIALANQQAHFFETVRSIQTIKVFAREFARSSQFANKLQSTINSNIQLERVAVTNRSITSAVYGLERVVTIFLGALFVLNAVHSLGTLIAFLAYRDQFASRVTNLVDRSFEIRTGGVLIDRITDFIVAEPESGLVAASDSGSNGTVRAENITFGYTTGDRPVLRDFSLSVDEGEHVVITGPSGSGKSTLISLLLGLVEPLEGRVVLGGHDIGRVAPAVWRRELAAVLQDDVLYSASVMENVTFFDVEPDRDKARMCLEWADLIGEVEGFPMGIMTQVGEGGGTLSGGQKQRLLLARALYAEPRILFLDEATSHVDAQSEKRILQALSALRITLIVAAHREESIRAADRVVRLG